MKKQLDLVVQINHKHQQRFERLSLSSEACVLTFGRAWDNDVVLQDPYVDADHLRIAFDDQGDMVVYDRASANGTLINAKPVQQGGQIYHLGEEIAVGDTTLKVMDVSVDVEPAIIRSGWFGFGNHFLSLSSFIGLTLFTLSLLMLSAWAFSNRPYGLAEASVGLLSSSLILLVWSLFFGFVSKLVRGQANFRVHWVLACLLLIFLNLTGLVLDVFKFNLQSYATGQLISNVVYLIIGLLFMFAVLSYSTFMSSRNKWVWSMLTVVIIFASQYSDLFLKKEHERWTQRTNTEQTTLPAALLVRKPVSLDRYFDDVNSIFEFDETNTGQ